MPTYDSLRSAGTSVGSSIKDLATNAVQAVRGLRMPGVGTPAPVTPGAPVSTPLPAIDPSLIDKAKSVVSGVADKVTNAAQGLRSMGTVGADGIPTLTNVARPGIPGPFPPQPAEIPTLTNVLQPGHPALQNVAAPTNPSFATGMSPERAAFNATSAAEMGPRAPIPTAASRAAGGLRDAGRFLKESAPTKLGGLATGAAAALAYAPDWHAFDDNSGLDAGQKAKLFARDTSRAVGGVAGGLVGGGFGTAFVPGVGTVAGGVAGGVAGAAGMDALGGGLRRGFNYVNEKLGGSPNYITSTDEDLASIAKKAPAGAPVAKDIIGQHYGTPAAPTPTTPDDIAAFNARMKEVGADSVGMRAGAQPNDRVLANTAPASQAMQDYTAQHMQERTNQLAAADEQYRSQAMQGLGAGSPLVTGAPLDMNRLNDDIEQAKRMGSPAAIQAAYNARDNALRTVSGDRQAAAQMATQRRGQDVTSMDNIRTTNATLAGNARMAAVAQRQYGLEERKFGAEQDKTHQAEREVAQKDLAEHLGKMFVGPDGKPDAVRVGDAVAKMNDEIGFRIQQAQAVPKDSPHYAEAQQLAAELSSKGIAALKDDDLATMRSQLAIRDRAKQLHGLAPGKATFVDSRLSGYAAKGLEPNLLGSDTVQLQNGGSIRANDLRYNEPANTLLPDFGKQATDQFNAGLGLRRKAQ